MRKQIAVFICAVSFDNQRRILEGILDCAKQKDVDVFVFTCHVNFLSDSASKQGAYNIMTLPDMSQFDGAIIVKNTIQYKPVADLLEERVRTSGIPAVSIDEKIPGMHYVGISHYDAQRKVIEHIVRDHGMTRINYVTGHITNEEGMGRYQAYRDVLKEHGIPFDQNRVYYGDYSVECGYEAVREFLSQNTDMPEAIICANDAMATGAIEALVKCGYRVPEDIAVTGFDNDIFTQFFRPSVTTIDRKQEEVGRCAVELILSPQSAGLINHTVETELIHGESCGCHEGGEYPIDKLRNAYVSKELIMQKAVEAIRSMSLDLAGVASMQQFYQRLEKYVRIADMESFYLCMCDEKKVFQDGTIGADNRVDTSVTCTKYTKKMTVPVAYNHDEFSTYGEYESRLVLPEECRMTKEASYYIISPIYYQNCCFGYCVSRNSPFVMQSELYYSWMVNIGIAIENIRKMRLLNKMVERLNAMWMYDMLTNVYNRRGFYFFSDNILKKIRRQKERAFIIFMDLDGLKIVNDTLGHECGDQFISEMAEVLKSCLRENELLMRYGGDEFVIFGGCKSDDEVASYVKSINDTIESLNAKAVRPYKLATSIGYSTYEAKEIENLSGLIEEADKKMYEQKREKRMR